jgi:hypothetical protein
MSETTEVMRPLSKGVAVVKWKHFFDSSIGGASQSIDHRLSALVRAGATEDSLKRFWNETKHLSWPATWGESPWETASTLGAALAAQVRSANSPAVYREYIESFRLALERRSPIAREVGISMDHRYAESVIGDRARLFDGIEIQGVREIIDPVDRAGSCLVDNDTPQFFSVYIHHCTGGVACVGDQGTHALARDYADELANRYGWPIMDYAQRAAATDDNEHRAPVTRPRM